MTKANLIQGDSYRLPLSSGSVHCIVTSPPYWGLRDYGLQPTLWGGIPDCQHEMVDNLCQICGAWLGCLGLEPTPRPAVVLDPFSGSGTTVQVARQLRRIGIGVDMSADYLQLTRQRLGLDALESFNRLSTLQHDKENLNNRIFTFTDEQGGCSQLTKFSEI